MNSLLESKFRVPTRRPNAITRPRLAQCLNAASRSALTVLSAPAGFGKTTALTEWIATVAPGTASIAWLSLDDRDNDPVQFWTYVVAALQAATHELAEAAPMSSPETGLLNDLGRLSKDLFLVLDDYHLIDAPEIHDAMTFLLEHQPAQLHLVLATRADPQLPLARMRARGELVDVRAADLRFTAEEAAAYLNGPMRLCLSERDVTALAGRTEGWIAALQLAALSMQGREDAGAFIAGFAGDDRFIVDYLAEEVLARQRADVREFLLETAVLERLTGPLCDAITGRTGGKAMLVALERANLFLVPLDDRREWYRYHHLFADVLRAHLLDERGAEADKLHLRASGWFEANGDASQAISHAVAGRDFDRAAELMELAMPMIQRERREAELGRWVHALPDDVVRVRPVLAIAFVGALAQRSEFDTVEARLRVVEESMRSSEVIIVDEREYRSVPARIEVYRAALSLAQSDLDGAVNHARVALSLHPPDDDLTQAAAGALAGLASWATGDLAGAHAAYTRSVAGLTSIGWLADVLGCSITLGDIRRTQGRLTDAAHTYQRALDLGPPGSPLRGTADMHVAMADLLVERDDLSAARRQLDDGERLGTYNGLPQNPYRSRLVAARLYEADGDLDTALTLIDEADRFYAGDYSPNVRPVPAVRARLRVRRGELNEAQAWAREQDLSASDELSYLREFEHITLARILVAERDGADDALALIDRLLAAALSGDRGGSVIELLVLRALAHQRRADVPAALVALARAVTLAQPERYVRMFADEGPPMAVLLKALAKRSADPGYVRRLLAATTRSTSRPSARMTGLVDQLSGRELDVLRLLGSDLGGPDIARELSVSLNTMRTHTKSIYSKLGVTSRQAAVRQARDLDLLPRH